MILYRNLPIKITKVDWYYDFSHGVKVVDDVYLDPIDDIEYNQYKFYQTKTTDKIIMKNMVSALVNRHETAYGKDIIGFWSDFSLTNENDIITDFSDNEIKVASFGELIDIYWTYDTSEKKFKSKLNNTPWMPCYVTAAGNSYPKRVCFIFILSPFVNEITTDVSTYYNIPNNISGLGGVKANFLVPFTMLKGSDVICYDTNKEKYGLCNYGDVRYNSNIETESGKFDIYRFSYNNDHPMNLPYKAFEFK